VQNYRENQGWDLNDDEIQLDLNNNLENEEKSDDHISNYSGLKKEEIEKILLAKEKELISRTNKLERLRENLILMTDNFNSEVISAEERETQLKQALSYDEEKVNQTVETSQLMDNNQTENVHQLPVKSNKHHSPIIIYFLLIFSLIYFTLLCICLYNRDKSNEETFEMVKKNTIETVCFMKIFLFEIFSLFNH